MFPSFPFSLFIPPYSSGHIEHVNWVSVYESLREATGTLSPGYLIHEAVRFNPVQRRLLSLSSVIIFFGLLIPSINCHVYKRWYFLPRRVSEEMYNDVLDERRGSNTAISMNEHFQDIKVFYLASFIWSGIGA